MSGIRRLPEQPANGGKKIHGNAAEGVFNKGNVGERQPDAVCTRSPRK
jgi:hypothetical protein